MKLRKKYRKKDENCFLKMSITGQNWWKNEKGQQQKRQHLRTQLKSSGHVLIYKNCD